MQTFYINTTEKPMELSLAANWSPVCSKSTHQELFANIRNYDLVRGLPK